MLKLRHCPSDLEYDGDSQMNANARITISCNDRVGLVSDISGRIFDIGANLGPTYFALEDGTAKFETSCELPDGCPVSECATALNALSLENADIKVEEIAAIPALTTAPGATHMIECSGIDQPGLIARLSEIFIEYNANIVRLAASSTDEKDARIYTTRFAVAIAPERASNCLATLANTAGSMRLVFKFDEL
ncbi:glycine cleavage system protein R [Thalassospira lucentensis]|uniref:glycine cleavage system protein R n=1 Tax=Thalassospira lucentensis TaxID=168935 RepID=UPI00399D6FE5